MTRQRGWGGLLLLALLATTGSARGASIVDETGGALGAEVGAEGLAWLSRRVKKELLVDQHGTLLPNIPIPTEKGTVWLVGPRLTVRFGEFAVTAGEGHLALRATASHLSLYIPRLYIPVAKGVNCYETKLHAGFRRPVVIRTRVGARVQGDRIALSELGTEVKLDPDNYAAQGPSYCRGLLIGNRIVRNAVAKALAKARQDVVSSARDEVRKILRQAEGYAAGLERDGVALDVTGVPLLKPGQLIARLAPRSLGLSSAGVKLGVEARFTRSRTLPPGAVPFRELAPFLGAITASSEAVNGLLGAAFAGGGAPLTVDPKDEPMVGGIFNRPNLVPSVPDLALQPLEREELQLVTTFRKPPRLTIVDKTARVCVPDLELHLRPTIGGAPVDYFAARIEPCLDVTLESTAAALVVRVPDAKLIGAEGAWLGTVKPKDLTIVATELEAFFRSVVELALLMDPLAEVPWPKLALGGDVAGLSAVDIGGAEVRVTFGGRPRPASN